MAIALTRAFLIVAAAVVAVGVFFPVPSAAVEGPCIPGHNTVVPPCSFDAGRLSLDTGIIGGQAGGGGGGHDTEIQFNTANPLNPIIEILATGTPFSSLESPTPLTLTLQIGACGPDPQCSSPVAFPGLAINEFSLALLGAAGNVSVSLSSAALGASVLCTAAGCTPVSGNAFFSPVGIISDLVLSGSFGAGGGSIVGIDIDLGLVTPAAVPEPGTLLFGGLSLGALGALYRRRSRR
jgi:hypothetical protein